MCRPSLAQSISKKPDIGDRKKNVKIATGSVVDDKPSDIRFESTKSTQSKIVSTDRDEAMIADQNGSKLPSSAAKVNTKTPKHAPRITTKLITLKINAAYFISDFLKISLSLLEADIRYLSSKT